MEDEPASPPLDPKEEKKRKEKEKKEEEKRRKEEEKLRKVKIFCTKKTYKKTFCIIFNYNIVKCN